MPDIITIREYWENLPRVEINWDESGNDYFNILIENIEDEPVDIFSGKKVSKGFFLLLAATVSTLKLYHNSITGKRF